MIKTIMPVLFCFVAFTANAQNKDTVIKVDQKTITLSEVVVDNKLNGPGFINRIKNDSSFYKAFRNLRILNYNAINDIRMMYKR